MVLIVDSKLMAYNELHRKQPVINLFATLANTIPRVEQLAGKKITRIIFTYDIGKSSYRLGLYSKYKGGRNYGTVPDDFKPVYEQYVKTIGSALGISNFPIKDLEADDIAGILSSKLTEEVILFSSDRDWDQIVLRHPDRVKYFNIKQFKLMGYSDIVEETGCSSEARFITKKCILGDSGDHIFGLPGIGPVTFSKWATEAFKLPDTTLKESFLTLGSRISGNKVHKIYSYEGLHSLEELWDYNVKLGTIMTGVKHLTEEQKIELNACWAIHCTKPKTNLEVASELSSIHNQGYMSAFGDPWYLSEDQLEIYRRIHG